MYYFYCPHCKYEESTNIIPRNAISNCRDGYGMGIYHYECPMCGNLDAGAMFMRTGDSEEQEYYQFVIELYQGIRGFKQRGRPNEG